MLNIKHAKTESQKIFFYPLGNMKEIAAYFAIFMGGIFLILLAVFIGDEMNGLSFLFGFEAVIYLILLVLYIIGRLQIVIDKNTGVMYYRLLGIKRYIADISDIYDLDKVEHPTEKWVQYFCFVQTGSGLKTIKLTQEIKLSDKNAEQAFDALLGVKPTERVAKVGSMDKCLSFKEIEPDVYECNYRTYGILSGCLVMAIIPVFAIGLFFSKFFFLLFIPMIVFYPKNKIRIDLNERVINVSTDDGTVKQMINIDEINELGSLGLKNMKGLHLSSDTYAYLNDGRNVKILDKPINDNGNILHDIKLLINKAIADRKL